MNISSVLCKFKDIVKTRFRSFWGMNILYSDIVYENRRLQLVWHILHDTEKGVTTNRYTDCEIIVSLTTFGDRINDVPYAIESIMQQSLKANRIILWLDNSFKSKTLPHALISQQRRGLEIFYCDDIRSYKKLIPSLRKFPNDVIITVDDDALYEFDVLEHLINAYLENPEYIHCCKIHRMRFNKKNQLLSYNKWSHYYPINGPDKRNMLIGVGGVLYPPHIFDDEVLNEKVFMEICKYADDVWFTAMALRNGVYINKVYTHSLEGSDYSSNEKYHVFNLNSINEHGENLNDKQIRQVFEKYNIYARLA